MKTNEASGFRFYSVAIVAANKKRGSFEIEAVPIEDSPMLDGELTDDTVPYQAKGTGVDGKNAFNHDLKTTASVKATWLPAGIGNRKTAPDVRRGERVALYKYRDSDKFWWEEMPDPTDETLRRLETVTHAFSNERQENKKLDHTNTYFLEVSTHEKYIHLETTKSDGEPFAYVVQINTKDGQVIIKDDDSNFIVLDSKNRTIRLENKDKSFVDINKTIINIESRDEVNIKTRRFTVNATDSITEKTQTKEVTAPTFKQTSQTYALSANSYSTTSSDFSVTTTSFKVSSPSSQFSGNFAIGGNLVVTGTSLHVGKSTGPGHI